MFGAKKTKGDIYVLLPAYNEAEALKALLPDIYHATDLVPANVHTIVVNDGSTDATAECAQWAPQGMEIEVINHPENRGLAGALITGIEHVLATSKSDDDILVGMDADNTHPPESIPKMIGMIWGGQDIIIASRYQPGSVQKGVPRFRRFLSWGARRLFSLLLPIKGVRDFTCGYRAYRIGVLREAWRRTGGKVITSEGFACTDEMLFVLAMLTNKINEIPFTLRYDRKPGESKLKLGLTIRAQLRVLGHLRKIRKQGLPQSPPVKPFHLPPPPH